MIEAQTSEVINDRPKYSASVEAAPSGQAVTVDAARTDLFHTADVATEAKVVNQDHGNRCFGRGGIGLPVYVAPSSVEAVTTSDATLQTIGSLALKPQADVLEFKSKAVLKLAVAPDVKPVRSKGAKSKEKKGKSAQKSKPNASDNEVKALCPDVAPGYWEARASDKGFSIHLRWRNENKILDDFMFAYLGKRELASIQKGNVNEQRNDIYDRLVGQLIREGREDLAARIEKPSQDN